MKYLFINTWNGEGYTDSKSEIIDTDNPLELAIKKATESGGGSIEIKENAVYIGDSEDFEESENHGAVHFVEYPDNLLAVLIEPDTNDYQLLTSQEELESIVEQMKESSDEYKEEGYIFGSHHTDLGCWILEAYDKSILFKCHKCNKESLDSENEGLCPHCLTSK